MVALKFGEELGGGGDGPLSWEGVFMGVVRGEVFGWGEKCFAKMSTLRLG